MSSNDLKSSPALNLYGAYSQELERMHEMYKISLASTRHGGGGSMGMGSYHGSSYGDSASIFGRIVFLQDVLIAALQSHDPVIQEKIAELALTGTKND